MDKYIADSDMIIFVGGEVSVYTTNNEHSCITWRGLLKNGLEKCVYFGRLTKEKFKEYCEKLDNKQANTDDFLQISSFILGYFKMEMEENQNAAFRNWLKETFGTIVPKKTDLITAIGKLDCPIFTTNYDLLLERVLNRKSLTWSNFQKECNEVSFNSLKNYILHVHGYYDEPETVVLDTEGYNKIRKNEFAQAILKAVMSTKTIFFIGFGSGMSDPSFSNLLELINSIRGNSLLPIYKLVRANKSIDESFDNIKTIVFGSTNEDLVKFVTDMAPKKKKVKKETAEKSRVLKNYLKFILNEYGSISIFGYSKAEIELELQKVYVQLKFDPTHPSIKAMKSLVIEEEFKRKVFDAKFFTSIEKSKIFTAYAKLCVKGIQNVDNFSKSLLIEPWLNNLLSDREIFNEDERTTIKDKVKKLKDDVVELSDLNVSENCSIKEAYGEFKHLVILGHPGAGKTTLSKWLVTNMAKQGLGIANGLFDGEKRFEYKLPIFIPIWKYIEEINTTDEQHKKTLLQFIYENPTVGTMHFKSNEDKVILSEIVKESLLKGDTMIILEGLDEIPVYMNRSDLMREINSLLERSIEYDRKLNKLSYSIVEKKEICSAIGVELGNRFIITSRIEGNYFQEINYYVPRLTIEDMSTDALESFCYSYMTCLNEASAKIGISKKQVKPQQLFSDIKQNDDILKLAINPQLASLIVSIYNQCDGVLPDKRIDLYEKAIEKMIERLVDMISSQQSSSISNNLKSINLNSTIMLTIMQEIAEYLHARTEGLSEEALKKLICNSIFEYQKGLDSKLKFELQEVTSYIVNLLKVHSGLLTEFGHNSFKFLHRTFQEYLAATNMIYKYGVERDEDTILRKLSENIPIPNWRVPLSMAFGIISKSTKTNLLNKFIKQLFDNERNSPDSNSSTLITPYVVVDSLNDIHFSSKENRNELVKRLYEILLLDFKNKSGFARLKEHQVLIQSYFGKLKDKFEDIGTEWFIETIESNTSNIAPCAKLLLELKWYDERLHEIFIKHLHHDSKDHNWPIDSILNLYATFDDEGTLLFKESCKSIYLENKEVMYDVMRVIISLYGGYKYTNVVEITHELYELASFLQLSDSQRRPFTFYYQETWGQDDPNMKMAIRADKIFSDLKGLSNSFNMNTIYKESSITEILIDYLKNPSIENFKQGLVDKLKIEKMDLNDKLDIFMAITALGDVEFVLKHISYLTQEDLKSFKIRIEQLMFKLKDPIACTTQDELLNYLIKSYSDLHSEDNRITFFLYCKIHMHLNGEIGAEPVDAFKLVKRLTDTEDTIEIDSKISQNIETYKFYSEYLAYTLTGASNDYFLEKIEAFLETFDCSPQIFVKSIFNIGNCVQLYKPIRSYIWPIDQFMFKNVEGDDLPISFLNGINNMNNEFSFHIKRWIFNRFKTEGIFASNDETKLLFVLFIFEDMSAGSNDLLHDVFDCLLPEITLNENVIDVKEFLFKQILQTMKTPFNKSRALCMLAKYYDSKSIELLTQAYSCSTMITTLSHKYQVLEEMLHVLYYTRFDQAKQIFENISNDLIIIANEMQEPYDKVIAFMRVAIKERSKTCEYLKNAIEILKEMTDETDKFELIIKIRPLTNLYKDLGKEIDAIILGLSDMSHKYYLNCNYGRILFNTVHLDDIKLNELNILYSLYALNNEILTLIEKPKTINDLWADLFNNQNDVTIIESLIEIAMTDGLILTPQAAIVIDKLIQNRNKNVHILFPYLVGASNEVLPIVYCWISNEDSVIKNLAALLLSESKWIFAQAVEPIKELLISENDILRYRAQRIFQHPDREPDDAEKRLSILGEDTIFQILISKLTNRQIRRVDTYMWAFFLNVNWDCPQTYLNLLNKINTVKVNGTVKDECAFFNKIYYINQTTWNTLIESMIDSTDNLYLEELYNSTVKLIERKSVDEKKWIKFSEILLMKKVSDFKDQLYLIEKDIDMIHFILEQTQYYIDNKSQFQITVGEFVDKAIMKQRTIDAQKILKLTYQQVSDISYNNYKGSNRLNEKILEYLNEVPVTMKLVEYILNFLLHKMIQFNADYDTLVSCSITSCLLSLCSGLAQKDDFIYRKITNSLGFNKSQFIQLLEKMLINHPYHDARGCAFILLAALDKPDPKILVNALNILLDENIVKAYSIIGIPMIRLSPNDFTKYLLKSLKSESAVKVYELLKIITAFAMNDKIDANLKSKILNFIIRESVELNSKRPVTFYYTNVRIPFTTTLEKELYKSWLKIQGLSGKIEL